MSNFNYDDKSKSNSSTTLTESTKFEINSRGDHLRHSAEPNMANANDANSDATIKNLNTNNSRGGSNGKDN